ncbi:response regulator [Bradyrhizobium sp. RD5-C2]|nr:response regulator [Bradyrhizobium sp. RD5-C2]
MLHMLAAPGAPGCFWGIALQDVPIILVIEDDRDLQMMVEDALRDGGYEPAIAGSGEEALTLLKAFRTKYSALVTDIRLLGRLDGWRVARGAREIDPSFPVLYITGGGGDEWPTRGVPDSVLLNKPFSPDELVAAVTKLLKNGAPA